jgi:hypothetical protein
MRMSKTLGAVLAVGAVAAVALPAAARRAAPPMIAIAMKWEGQQGGPEKETREVIQDAAAFEKSWAAKAVPAEEARKIDFAKQTVLAVATGTRNTGGFSIAVTAIYDNPEFGPRRGEAATPAKVTVSVVETKPKPDALLIQVITSPWQVVVIPKTAKPVEFRVTAKLE